MNKTMTSLLAVGIGAAAYTMMRDRRKRNSSNQWLRPLRSQLARMK